MKATFEYKTATEIALENEWSGKNPFGLLYEGAVAENKPGRVNIHPIAYDNRGVRIAANVYTPPAWNP